MPHNGSIQPGAARAFFETPTDGRFRIATIDIGSGVVQDNCNKLWRIALDWRDNGHPKVDQRPTYFAMLHADVAPLPGWLDLLIDELESTGADLVSVVIPHRDITGLTSSGIAKSGDWRESNVRRLTLTELHDLPETFGRDAIQWEGCDDLDCFIFNTGCFACRLDADWVDQIVWRMESYCERGDDGTWDTRTFSEDWMFSLDAAEYGANVLMTRKVRLFHGQPHCHNAKPWGNQKRDEKWFAAQQPCVSVIED
jgi:hypothetical protein